MTGCTSAENSHFQLFIHGNEKGFNYLYENLYKAMLNYARSILQNDFEIRSIVQDAFLKAWDFRKRIATLLHFKRFVRLCIRWKCYDYFKRNRTRIDFNIMPLDSYRETHIATNLQEEEEQRFRVLVEEEQLQLIERAIPYLRGSRKNIMELSKRGFTHKQIARCIGVSYQRIPKELERILEMLKRIVPRLKKAADAFRRRPVLSVSNFEAYLNPQQTRVLSLYFGEKYSFQKISQGLNQTQFQTMKQYFSAMKKLNQLSKSEAKKVNINRKSY